MHFRGHVDPWCKDNCNPDKFASMNMVNVSRYLIARIISGNPVQQIDLKFSLELILKKDLIWWFPNPQHINIRTGNIIAGY